MKLHATMLAAATLVGMASAAQAGQTIASPTFRTGVDNGGACYVRNVGRVPVSVQVKISQNFGADLLPSFQSCNQAPLAPGRTCVALVADLPDDVTFACSATASGSAKYLRGTLELRDLSPVFKVLVAGDLE
jgi:hypothetical protein